MENYDSIGKYSITASHSRTNTATGITELEGNVRISLPDHDFTLLCNRALYFERQKRAEAFGNVIMTHGEYRATSNKALFYEDGPRVMLTQRPVIMQGNNTISADLIEFWRFENQFHFKAVNNVKARYLSDSNTEVTGADIGNTQPLTASARLMHAVRITGAAEIISETVDLQGDVYVHLLRDNIVISSDEMNIRQPEDTILAVGNVNFYSDDLTSKSGKAFLENKKQILTLSDYPVVLRDDDTLSGHEIVVTKTEDGQIIDVDKDVYGRFIDDQGKLTEVYANQAHAVRVTGSSEIPSDTIYLNYDIRLLHPEMDLIITGDKAVLWEPEGKAEIVGNVKIDWQDSNASAGRVLFFRESERVEMFESPEVRRLGSTITGQSMYYWNEGDLEFIKVSGSARIDYDNRIARNTESEKDSQGLDRALLKADLIEAVRLTESASMKNMPGYVRPEIVYMTDNVDLQMDRKLNAQSDRVSLTSNYAEYHRPAEYALAVGDVFIKHKDYNSTSQKAEFWLLEDSVLLTGDPVVRDMSDPELPVETKGEMIRVFKQKRTGYTVIYCESCEGNTLVDTTDDPRLKKMNIKPF
jgi:lipopolysaccharide export system protein LptA